MSKFRTVALLAACSIGSLAQRSAFDHDRKPERVRVQVIAISYRTLHGISGGQDVYIASVQIRRQRDQEALIIDGFREPSVAIDLTVLAERRPLDMVMVRDPQCDRKVSELVRPRSAQEVYDATTLGRIDHDPEQVLPCYRVLHESIRLAKR